MRRLFKLPAAVLLAVSLAVPTFADDDDDERDQERALRALESGEVLPLAAILERAEAMLTGRMIEAELDRDDGLWIYELTLLSPEGHVIEAEFDARTAELLGLEGRALERIIKRQGQ